jgi:hypothetical protein
MVQNLHRLEQYGLILLRVAPNDVKQLKMKQHAMNERKNNNMEK